MAWGECIKAQSALRYDRAPIKRKSIKKELQEIEALFFNHYNKKNMMKIIHTILYFITPLFSQTIFTSEPSYAVYKCNSAINRTVKTTLLPNITRSFDYKQLTPGEKLIIDANIARREAELTRGQNELQQIFKNKKEIETEKYMVIAKPS